jgi:hypothetical protein
MAIWQCEKPYSGEKTCVNPARGFANSLLGGRRRTVESYVKDPTRKTDVRGTHRQRLVQRIHWAQTEDARGAPNSSVIPMRNAWPMWVMEIDAMKLGVYVARVVVAVECD